MAAISQSDIGKRVTIRLKDGDGYRDLVGHLRSLKTIENRHGQIVEFDPEQIHIWREITEVVRTASSGAPLSVRIYDLERVLNATWRAKIEEERDGWLFRFDNGITRRANSALVLTNSKSSAGSRIDERIDEVIGWYRNHNFAPTLQFVPTLHGDLDERLNARGFKDSIDALVMVKDHQPVSVDFEYEVKEEPTEDWLATQNDHQIADLMRRSAAKYLSLRIGEKVVAVGRIAFEADWAVLSRIWVDPEFRGQGLGRKILLALESNCHAPKIALQVATSNTLAINLYESTGYQSHHLYRFRALPQRIDLLQDQCC